MSKTVSFKYDSAEALIYDEVDNTNSQIYFVKNEHVKIPKQLECARVRMVSGMPDEEAMRLFHKFTGSIDGDIDIETEKSEYFYEKYGV